MSTCGSCRFALAKIPGQSDAPEGGAYCTGLPPGVVALPRQVQTSTSDRMANPALPPVITVLSMTPAERMVLLVRPSCALYEGRDS